MTRRMSYHNSSTFGQDNPCLTCMHDARCLTIILAHACLPSCMCDPLSPLFLLTHPISFHFFPPLLSPQLYHQCYNGVFAGCVRRGATSSFGQNKLRTHQTDNKIELPDICYLRKDPKFSTRIHLEDKRRTHMSFTTTRPSP